MEAARLAFEGEKKKAEQELADKLAEAEAETSPSTFRRTRKATSSMRIRSMSRLSVLSMPDIGSIFWQTLDMLLSDVQMVRWATGRGPSKLLDFVSPRGHWS